MRAGKKSDKTANTSLVMSMSRGYALRIAKQSFGREHKSPFCLRASLWVNAFLKRTNDAKHTDLLERLSFRINRKNGMLSNPPASVNSLGSLVINSLKAVSIKHRI